MRRRVNPNPILGRITAITMRAMAFIETCLTRSKPLVDMPIHRPNVLSYTDVEPLCDPLSTGASHTNSLTTICMCTLNTMFILSLHFSGQFRTIVYSNNLDDKVFFIYVSFIHHTRTQSLTIRIRFDRIFVCQFNGFVLSSKIDGQWR